MVRDIISLSVGKQDCRKTNLCYIDPNSNTIMSDHPGSLQRSCEELQSNTKEEKSPLTRPSGLWWDEAEVLGCLLDSVNSVLGSSVTYTVNLLSMCECVSEGLNLTLNVLHKIQHQQLNGSPDLTALVSPEWEGSEEKEIIFQGKLHAVLWGPSPTLPLEWLYGVMLPLRCKRSLLGSREVLLGRGRTFRCLESGGESLDPALEMGAWESSLSVCSLVMREAVYLTMWSEVYSSGSIW